MFGLGIPELLIIFVIALIIFGPKKLPDLGKSIGRAMAEFKKASDEFQDSVKAEMKEVEKSADIEGVKKLADVDFAGYGNEPPKPADEPNPEQKSELAPEQQPDPKNTGEGA
jgi:sec-independent protein translocase protein TatA